MHVVYVFVDVHRCVHVHLVHARVCAIVEAMVAYLVFVLCLHVHLKVVTPWVWGLHVAHV